MIKLRIVPVEQITKALAKSIDVAILAMQEHQQALGLQQSCISCAHFTEKTEQCKLYKARPPARIIAFSCPSYDDADSIPF